ncbi:MAG: hypothetical protein RR523_00885 [Cetobacterium sp.]|uniref:hypothetical protein n=1 Tax=Cetobacterium sp. TaxID=2071632 RepID=UPI002FC6FA67
MEKNRIPIFEKGKILDKDMLDELKNLNLDYVNTLYFSKSDGVIYGIDSEVKENKIIINPGLIKYNGELFKILTKKEIEIPLEDGEYKYFLQKIDKTLNDKFLELHFELKLFRDEEKEANGFEIFRILRREGANLKEPIKIIGIEKEYNTLNLINLKISTLSGSNLSSKLLKLYAQNMLKNKKLDTYERVICMYILNSNHEREFILKYLNIPSEANNLEIYKALEERYLNLEDNDKGEKNMEKNTRKMLVD